MEDIYGGSNDEGTVTHGSRVTLTGGTVGTVYGGGLGAQTKVKGGAKVDISGDTHVTKDVYGGGNRGTVEDGTDVKIH